MIKVVVLYCGAEGASGAEELLRCPRCWARPAMQERDVVHLADWEPATDYLLSCCGLVAGVRTRRLGAAAARHRAAIDWNRVIRSILS